MSILIENIRNRRHHHTNPAQDRQRPLWTHILIKRNPHDSEASSHQIPRESHERQCGGGVDFVGVDDVHVGSHEDADEAVAEEDGGHDRGPDANTGLEGRLEKRKG